MSPQALQKRMMHGNVYPDPRKAELALHRFFTIENLTALRDLALMRVADRVDTDLLERWSKGRTVPDTRERVLVCVQRSELAEDLSAAAPASLSGPEATSSWSTCTPPRSVRPRNGSTRCENW